MAEKQSPSIEQTHALIDESQIASNLILLGLRELQKINGGNDFYHLPFLLLSSGIERFLKCTLCIIYYYNKGNFPSNTMLRKKGHNLKSLLDSEILEHIPRLPNSERLPFQEDYIFVTEDHDLKRIIDILSGFGKGGRYYNLDIVTNACKPIPDSESEWLALEMDIVLRDEILKTALLDSDKTLDIMRLLQNSQVFLFQGIDLSSFGVRQSFVTC